MIHISKNIRNLIIRREERSDFPMVFELIQKAFESEEMSDHREQFLVEKLHWTDNFIPELSLVAEINKEIVGYILLTKIMIKNSENEFQALALAPVAVLPKFQKQGIGGELIKRAHERAKELGYESVILVGHENYYPKFGYQPAKKFDIHFPVEIPEKNFMAIELVKDGLKNVSGMVIYPPEFNIQS